MLTLIPDLPSNVVGVEADGKVTSEDYERLLVSLGAFAWMLPGEVKAFELDDFDDAREWITAGD